jgi:hypothetical protein
MVVGSMTVLTPVYGLFAVFALVTLLPIIVRLATGGDELHYGMATLAAIFLAAMLVVGKRIHATTTNRCGFDSRTGT